MRIVGRIIPFRELSVDLGGFREWIAPEAVDSVLSDGTDVRALVAHDSRMVLGRVGNGMLRLEKSTLRGYRKRDFGSAWARYRPVAAPYPQHVQQPNTDAGFRAISDPQQTPHVTDPKSDESPRPERVVTHVTDTQPLERDFDGLVGQAQRIFNAEVVGVRETAGGGGDE